MLRDFLKIWSDVGGLNAVLISGDRKCRGVEKRPLEVCTGDLVRNTKQQNV
jgi:hypothetical protein